MLHGDPSEKLLQHIVKVVKLLHRFHYPVTAPARRDIGGIGKCIYTNRM